MSDKELVLKWYKIFTETEMTPLDALEFIEDCETFARAEKIMELMQLRHHDLDM